MPRMHLYVQYVVKTMEIDLANIKKFLHLARTLCHEIAVAWWRSSDAADVIAA